MSNRRNDHPRGPSGEVGELACMMDEPGTGEANFGMLVVGLPQAKRG